jgi:hypothetical protein
MGRLLPDERSVLYSGRSGNQVCKTAISGWRDIIQAACAAGARLWPFDGVVQTRTGESGLVLCETYPGEAYSHIGVIFEAGASKRRQDDRKRAAVSLAARCSSIGIQLDAPMAASLSDGFGSDGR